MLRFPHILADGENIGKVVFGIIAVIFWAVGSISSAMNKQRKEREQRARELEALARQGMQPREPAPPAPPPPIPVRQQLSQTAPRVQQRTAAPPPPPPVPGQQQQRRQPQQRRQSKQQRSRVPVPPPPPVVAQLEEILPSAAPRVPSAQRTAPAHPIAVLLRKSLRTQIVLNEILQPPVALREPREI